MVCSDFLAFARPKLYKMYLAVPIKGLLRMVAGRRHSLIYILSGLGEWRL
jgi:hypothetical protein